SSRSWPSSSKSVMRANSCFEEEEDGLPEQVVEGEDQRHQDEEGHQHDDRVVDDLASGGPRDLAQLAPHLAEVLGGARALFGGARRGTGLRRAARRSAVGRELPLALHHPLRLS